MDKAKDCPLKIVPETRCPNIKCVYEGFDKETWECKKCGVRFSLYYDEMQ